MRVVRQFTIDVGTAKTTEVVDRLHGVLEQRASTLRRKGPRGTPRFVFNELPDLLSAPPDDGLYPNAPEYVDKQQPLAGDLTIRELYDGTTQVLAATSEPGLPPESPHLPELFDSARELLTVIGTPKQTGIELIRPNAELKARKLLAAPRYEDHVEIVDAVLAAVTLHQVSGEKGAPIPAAVKDIKATFKPLGYRRKKWPGSTVLLTKRTASFNTIWLEISCDSGSLWRRTEGESKRDVVVGMNLAGIDWWQGGSLPVAAGSPTPLMEIVVRDQGEWLKLLDNIVMMMRTAEEVFFPIAEAVYGTGFAWYEPPP